MAAKPVQISLDVELLARVDRDPQTRKQGRSAFIRDAIELYLAAKRERDIDAQLEVAYRGKTKELHAELVPFLRIQSWPED